MKATSIALVTALVALIAVAPAVAADPPLVLRGAEVVGEEVVPTIVDVDLRDLPIVPDWKPGDPIKEVPRLRYPRTPVEPEPPTGPDALADLQSWRQTEALPTPGLSFAGQGYTGVNPPDTVGDVGGAVYIQSINGSGGALVRIHNKTTGAVVAGPFAMDSLGTGNCASGLGDPIILFDEAANRWMISEFSNAGNRMCVYISQTADPVAGGWCAYQFTAPSFPDYPKYGVWPDAYYVTSNESSPAIYAFDRVNMISCGTALPLQRFTVGALSGFGFQALTPADSDDVAPPPGSPGIIMRHRDTEVHGPAGMPTQDLLEMFAFHVDWATPANSTLTALPSIPVTEFDSDLCGLTSFNCFPQPGTGTTLDPLREVIMFRLAYRNFGAHQTLVGNLVTDVTGTNRGGVRWFELRKSGANWTLFQEGTYSIDTDSRWMGASAMDVVGNIALGYNVSSTTTFPSLRYTGRLVGDPLGTMSASEAVLAAGTASNGSNRYGDYASMSVDPEDGCTFWFTGEYNTASQWSTHIGSFKFAGCGRTPDFYLGATPSAQGICAPANAVYTINVGQTSGFTNQVTLVASGNPAGTTTGFSANPVTPPGATTLTIGNTGAAAPGSYTVQVAGTATGSPGHSTNLGLDIFAGSPAAPTLSAPANGATNVILRPVFSWAAAAGAVSYVLEVDNDPGFGSIDYTATVTGTSHTAATDLASNTAYSWRVRASNPCGAGSNSAVWTFSTVPLPGDCAIGFNAVTGLSEGFESGPVPAGWTTSGSNPWAQSTLKKHSGTYSFLAVDQSTAQESVLVSPAVVLPTGHSLLTLQFWNDQTMEDRTGGCYDGGILEISNNGGTTWTHVPTTKMLTDPYNGPINGTSNVLNGLDGWCGDPQPWLESVVDIDAYAGQAVKFRFRLGSDSSVGRAPDGWYLDDLVVQSCAAAGHLFAHGFESGNFVLWSGSTP